ncbi:MAG: glycoside hydrolase family 9 protein [Uliginosibacterium sp.]|nr:glycoside hydrolase family 9 protein [Uliginosibacterium sp.]
MVPTTPVIRYNQVVTGPEDAAGNTYFTVVNPPVGSTVYRVSASGTSSAIKVILASDRGNDDNYGLPAVAVPVPFGSGSYKVQLRNGANTVLAETPMLTGTGTSLNSGPYTVRAPLLRRDALHFFYAQRAGEAIVDGRYPEYRNPFSREAGHVKEVAKCFSGVDNFGNDFSGACKTAAGRDPYAGRSPRPVDGGWYDAGDHGKYVVNGATALWALHNVIESHRSTDALNSFFPDGYLMHGTNGVSDLLDEAEYEKCGGC